MTPNQKEKPPIILSHGFQSVLLIFIAGTAVSLLVAVISYSNGIARKFESHDNKIEFLQERTKNLEVWRDLVVNKEYELRQGKTQQP